MKSFKIAIVVGHSETSQGAINPRTGVTEFEFNKTLAELLECDFKEIYSTTTNYIPTIVYRKLSYAQLPTAVNLTGADICISLHANAFNGGVEGCETLYYHSSEKGRLLAALVQGEVNSVLGNPNRGMKPKHSEDRGGYLLNQTSMPCIITEPFFIDNDNDYELGNTALLRGDLSEAIVKAVVSYCKEERDA